MPMCPFVQVQFTFDPAKCTQCSCSTLVAPAEVWPYHRWRSGSFTFATTSAAGEVQGQFADLQVPPSSSSIISGWDVHSCLSNQQPMSPPLWNTRRPGSSTNQTGKIRKKKILCVWSAAVELTTLPLTVCDLSLTLSSAHNLRYFCFPEPTGHHHSASMTVLPVKFVCMNTNLLTYLLTYYVSLYWRPACQCFVLCYLIQCCPAWQLVVW